MAVNSVSSDRPARSFTSEARKNAPWKALPCMRSCRSALLDSSRAILNASRKNTRIWLSTMYFWMCIGKDSHSASALPRLLWMMNTPPWFRPSTALVCPNTCGSGDITTSTRVYSQLMRMGSGAADR